MNNNELMEFLTAEIEKRHAQLISMSSERLLNEQRLVTGFFYLKNVAYVMERMNYIHHEEWEQDEFNVETLVNHLDELLDTLIETTSGFDFDFIWDSIQELDEKYDERYN